VGAHGALHLGKSIAPQTGQIYHVIPLRRL